jgi:histidinol-phosphate aminotransferase
MNRVKPPYNVSGIAQRAVNDALDERDSVNRWIAAALEQRTALNESLNELSFVENVYPSDANFILVKVTDAYAVYSYLVENKIVVRNRNNVELCGGCLRITVGTPEENRRLLASLEGFESR